MKRGIFITIRPISDLQDNFSEIGEVVLNTGESVFSTKKRLRLYGSDELGTVFPLDRRA